MNVMRRKQDEDDLRVDVLAAAGPGRLLAGRTLSLGAHCGAGLRREDKENDV